MEEKYFVTRCVPCPKSGYVEITRTEGGNYLFRCKNDKCEIRDKVDGIIIDFTEMELYERNHMDWVEAQETKKNPLIKYTEQIFEECIRIMKRKNSDYGAGDDPLKNFRMVENSGLCRMETGIVVRMSDKFQRVINLLEKEPSVKEESIQDTLVDLINYAAILMFTLNRRNHGQG